jgi:hypothetical protein
MVVSFHRDLQSWLKTSLLPLSSLTVDSLPWEDRLLPSMPDLLAAK